MVARRSPARARPSHSGVSELESKFALLWRAISGPPLVTEYRFHETRKWRFDFAHLASKTAIEIEGGTWINGRHNRGSGFVADCEKYNHAAALGWRIFRLPASMIRQEWLISIKEAIQECKT